jgi:hypothetical protein
VECLLDDLSISSIRRCVILFPGWDEAFRAKHGLDPNQQEKSPTHPPSDVQYSVKLQLRPVAAYVKQPE